MLSDAEYYGLGTRISGETHSSWVLYFPKHIYIALLQPVEGVGLSSWALKFRIFWPLHLPLRLLSHLYQIESVELWLEQILALGQRNLFFII